MFTTIAQRINHGMQTHGFNQVQLAKLSGINASSISNYCRNLQQPSPTNVLKLAKALNMNPDYLTGAVKHPMMQYQWGA